MADAYLQYLDFRSIKKQIAKNEKEIEKSGRDPLKDLSGIPEEITQFFNDVLFAQSSSELDKYTDELLDDAERLLDGTNEVLGYIENVLNDTTILAPSNETNIRRSLKERAIKAERRVL